MRSGFRGGLIAAGILLMLGAGCAIDGVRTQPSGTEHWVRAAATTAAAQRPARSGPGAFGDFNGDGLADIVVAGRIDGADGEGSPLAHSAVVAFGARSPSNVDLGAVSAPAGLRIHTALAIFGVSTVGDVDGDGFADVAVSTRAPSDRGPQGGEYLVFGRSDPTPVDLDRSADGVQRIPEALPSHRPVGDLNADGRDEMVFSAGERSLAVIFGRSDRARITAATLRSPGRRGFVVDLGPWRDGADVAGSAGDANGDGIGDLVLSLENYYYCGEGGSGCGGRAFVIFGRKRPVSLEITGSYRAHHFAVLTRRGHKPAGYYINAILGYDAIGSPGDFDGDRLDDLFGTGWEYGQGTVLVYGRRSTRAPRANPPRAPDAARIRHVEEYYRDCAGPLGDVNGDGLGDVLVSPVHSETSVVIVLGRRKRATIDVDAPEQSGIWRMAASGDLSSLGRIGDVNGDGIDDLALGTSEVLHPGAQSGSTYVMLGTRGAPPRDIREPGTAGFVIR